jgi:hypothetical protein
MNIDKYALLLFVAAILAPGCNCSSPELTICDPAVDPSCITSKNDHEVICSCTIDTPLDDAGPFDLHVCLPPSLNNATGDAAAIDAMPEADYAAAVAAFCQNDVRLALHDITGFLNSDACEFATIECGLTPASPATLPNSACDLPCAETACTAENCNPDVVAPSVEDIHPELCKCTTADGCGDIASSFTCLTPTWAPDPPTIATGLLARLVSLPSDVEISPALSSGTLTVTAAPGIPCTSDTQSVALTPSGTAALYGRPCTGEACNYLFEFSVHVDDFSITFDNGLICGDNTATVTHARVTGGTEGYFIALDSFGNGIIPAGSLRLHADAIVNGERFVYESYSTEAIPLHVDFAAQTFEMLSAPIVFADGSVTVNLVGTIFEQPPVADAGADQPSVECTSPAGATVQLDATGSSDPDGDPGFFNWWNGQVFDPSALLGAGATLAVVAPIGTSDFAVSMSDDRLATSTDRTEVTVVDTTGPAIDVDITPDELWPPNHKLVKHDATVVVQDVCDPGATFVLTSITSNEPDNGLGDGNTVDDVQGADFGTPDTEFFLRAERQGNGDGRTYTVVYTATDSANNSTEVAVVIQVPHDHGN